MNKKTIIHKIKSTLQQPTTLKQLAKQLKISVDEKKELKKLVHELTAQGVLVKIKGNRYGLAEKIGLVTGILQGHSGGYGFVIPENKDEETDVYIKSGAMGGAMHKDKVVCRVEKGGKKEKREGSIIKILDRAHSTVVGIYEQCKNFAFVLPAEKRIFQDIFIPKVSSSMRPENGEVVIAKITKYPERGKKPEGKIQEILGAPDDPNVETDIIIRKYGLKEEFPFEVIKESKKFPVHPSRKVLEKRRDLRRETIFTIDGEDAKDFDDAVSITLTPEKTYKLGVHIADVSYYVKEESTLDKEALERGTSVYFPDRVLPMLPFTLSNNLCSLKPNEDRLTLSAIIEIDKKGEVVDYEIVPSVIHSVERLTYTDVASLLAANDKELQKRYVHILNDLGQMKKLWAILRKKRIKEGSIDFDIPEAQIILNEDGKPIDIQKRERNCAHQIIEEFMLLANKVVATHLLRSKIPALYRVHESPDSEKVDTFAKFIHNFGCDLTRTDPVDPHSFQEILSKVEGTPEERMISTIMLRTMKKAIYSTKEEGHFGLSFSHYTHFTSPIRRYPDLVVHRLLKFLMDAPVLAEDKRSLLKERLENITSHSSERERNAEEASREMIEVRQIQFMEDKVGEVFTGHISGITSFGIFVELDKYFVEGLLHISNLQNDYYIYEEEQYCLIGERTKKRFRIGDELRVRIYQVSSFKREIDLRLENNEK